MSGRLCFALVMAALFLAGGAFGCHGDHDKGGDVYLLPHHKL